MFSTVEREELEVACLEGLILTSHGHRYSPAIGAEAVERLVSARFEKRERELRAEFARRVNELREEPANSEGDLGYNVALRHVVSQVLKPSGRVSR